MFAMTIVAVQSFGRRDFIEIALTRGNRTILIHRGQGDGGA